MTHDSGHVSNRFANYLERFVQARCWLAYVLCASVYLLLILAYISARNPRWRVLGRYP